MEQDYELELLYQFHINLLYSRLIKSSGKTVSCSSSHAMPLLAPCHMTIMRLGETYSKYMFPLIYDWVTFLGIQLYIGESYLVGEKIPADVHYERMMHT